MRNINSPDLSTLLSHPQPHHYPKHHQWHLTSFQSKGTNTHGKSSREKDVLTSHARELVSYRTQIGTHSYIHLCWLLLEFLNHLHLLCRGHLLQITIACLSESKYELQIRQSHTLQSTHVLTCGYGFRMVIAYHLFLMIILYVVFRVRYAAHLTSEKDNNATPKLMIYLIHCCHSFTGTLHTNSYRSLCRHCL